MNTLLFRASGGQRYFQLNLKMVLERKLEKWSIKHLKTSKLRPGKHFWLKNRHDKLKLKVIVEETKINFER